MLIDDPIKAIDFILGGNATFTLKSLKTGKHYTYRVRRNKAEKYNPHPPFFVRVLTEGDRYTYLGFIPTDGLDHLPLCAGKKGDSKHPAFVALKWTMDQLFDARIPTCLEIRHEGRCCRCNRVLTTPESIDAGIGPECVKKL